MRLRAAMLFQGSNSVSFVKIAVFAQTLGLEGASVLITGKQKKIRIIARQDRYFYESIALHHFEQLAKIC